MENNINVLNTNINSNRKSNFELLRILAMIMIVFHHFAVHGEFSFSSSIVSLNRIWYYFILMGGKIGVDIFVLISGYFLITKDSPLFDFKKILKFWGQMFFYSISIYLIFVLFFNEEFSISTLLSCFMPILNKEWWFATTYIVLFILHPFINILLKKLEKKTFQILLIITLSLWCIIPTITDHALEGNSLLWFITLYCTAGYIRLYGLNSKFTSKQFFILWIVFTILTLGITIILAFIGTKHKLSSSDITYLYPQNTIAVFLISITLFLFFEKLNFKHNKIINTISSTTFGVYLIHDMPIVRVNIWKNLFQTPTYTNSNILIIYSIGICILVFVVGSIIELIRKHTIEKIYIKFFDRFINNINRPVIKLFDFISNFLFGEN